MNFTGTTHIASTTEAETSTEYIEINTEVPSTTETATGDVTTEETTATTTISTTSGITEIITTESASTMGGPPDIDVPPEVDPDELTTPIIVVGTTEIPDDTEEDESMEASGSGDGSTDSM